MITSTSAFSQAVQVGNTVYVSGVLGLNKDTMKLIEGGATHETELALTNLGHILAAADSNYSKGSLYNPFARPLTYLPQPPSVVPNHHHPLLLVPSSRIFTQLLTYRKIWAMRVEISLPLVTKRSCFISQSITESRSTQTLATRIPLLQLILSDQVKATVS